jgi:hypothetical protein
VGKKSRAKSKGGYPAATPGATAPPARVSGWLSYLTPNLALAVTIGAACYCLFIFDSPRRLFADADPGWHIRSGDLILSTGAVPHADPFSFLELRKPWYAFEWAAEVLMSVAHRAAGMPGIAFLFTFVILAAVWAWFHLNGKLGGNFFVSCLLAPPFVATVQTHWLARPHVLAHLLLVGALLYLETAPSRFRRRDAAVLFLTAVVWANVHGSFPLIIVLALCYAVGKHLYGSGSRWYWWAAACAFAGTLVNPYGLRLHQHVILFTISPELRPLISEWTPLDFSSVFGIQPAIVVAIVAIGGLLALFQKRLHHFLICGLLVWFSLQASRGLALAALAGLPLANAAITAWLRQRAARGPSSRLANLFSLSDQLRTYDANFNGAALVPLLVAFMLVWFRSPAVAARTGYDPRRFPVEAAAAVDKLPESSRLMASLAHGGYLIYHLEGRRKIFVDGRVDYYGPEPHLDCVRMLRAKAGWERLFEKYRFTHALVENTQPLSAALEKSGWRILYSDALARLYQRP